MNPFEPVAIPLPEEGDDPRLGHLLGKNLTTESPLAVLIGFPSDEGVRRNGGRPGAASAPDAIRELLYTMTPDAEQPEAFEQCIGRIKDLGNYQVTGDLQRDQEAFGRELKPWLQKGVVPVILGGGHETAFAHFSGYAEAGLKTAILNLDAHADVRPLKNDQPHSGSPFRQAILHRSGACEMYLVAGLQPHSVARSHLAFIEEHEGQYQFRDDTHVTSLSALFDRHYSERLMVTFDMDAVDQAFAPGVSAPCANGLHSDLWLTAAYLAGRNERVTSFDLSEVNPAFDRDRQTARLGALTVWQFLLGLSQRTATLSALDSTEE